MKQRLAPYVREVGGELGLTAPDKDKKETSLRSRNLQDQVAGGGRRVEVMP